MQHILSARHRGCAFPPVFVRAAEQGRPGGKVVHIEDHRRRAKLLRSLCLTFLVLLSATPASAATFISRAHALGRPNVAVKTSTTSDQYRVARPSPETTYDLRRFSSTAWPYSLSFGTGMPGQNTVVVGGLVRGGIPVDIEWQEAKSNFDGSALIMAGTGVVESFDLRLFAVFDGWRGKSGAAHLVDGCYMKGVHDDAFEADDPEVPVTIRDCLVVDVNNDISLGQNEQCPSCVSNVRDTIFIHRPLRNDRAPDGWGHQTLFKQPPGGVVNITNVTDCLYEQPITPSRIGIRPRGAWTDVTFVLGPGWTGDDPAVPAGAAVSRDWQGLCIDAARAWRQAHGRARKPAHLFFQGSAAWHAKAP